jgi:hypothetical protein
VRRDFTVRVEGRLGGGREGKKLELNFLHLKNILRHRI